MMTLFVAVGIDTNLLVRTAAHYGLDTRDLLIDPLDLFLKDYHDKTALDRAIPDHLLHQTFATADGVSPGLTPIEIAASLAGFAAVYGALAVVWVRLVLRIARTPAAPDREPAPEPEPEPTW